MTVIVLHDWLPAKNDMRDDNFDAGCPEVSGAPAETQQVLSG